MGVRRRGIRFLAWLARELRRTDAAALSARAREPLEADESDVVRRYAFYFGRPGARARIARRRSRRWASPRLVLVPWLIYKLQWAQAILIGVFAVRGGAARPSW